jgi:hypothetical protein
MKSNVCTSMCVCTYTLRLGEGRPDNKQRNALQAVLERQARETKAEQPAPAAQERAGEAASPALEPKYSRTSRTGRKPVAGHFDLKVAKQLKLLAAEEEPTIQALLEEALDLLFMKTRAKVISKR